MSRVVIWRGAGIENRRAISPDYTISPGMAGLLCGRVSLPYIRRFYLSLYHLLPRWRAIACMSGAARVREADEARWRRSRAIIL